MNFGEASSYQAQELYPLVSFDYIRTIIWKPDGVNSDPTGVTSAYDPGARQKGEHVPFN